MIIQSIVLILIAFICGALINSSVPIWIIISLGFVLLIGIISHISYLIKVYHSIPKEDLNIESVESHKEFLKLNYDL
jgi:ABC-type multidrug transport system permease subunit